MNPETDALNVPDISAVDFSDAINSVDNYVIQKTADYSRTKIPAKVYYHMNNKPGMEKLVAGTSYTVSPKGNWVKKRMN